MGALRRTFLMNASKTFIAKLKLYSHIKPHVSELIPAANKLGAWLFVASDTAIAQLCQYLLITQSSLVNDVA